MTVHNGWQGRFYEDFVVGDVYEHSLGRTITTTTDNIWFTLLTQNTAPLHFDHEYAKRTEFGKSLVNSTLTLSLVAGQSVASRPGLSVVTVSTTGLKQAGDVVIEFTRALLVYKRGHGPRAEMA